MPAYEVTSELYSEFDYRTKNLPSKDGYVVSEFPFKYPANNDAAYDEDGDLIVEHNRNGIVQIEHSISTALPLVGLQVWRGALLLADLALHWGHAGRLKDTNLLELGAGTGLSSFVAAMYAKSVVCTGVSNVSLGRHGLNIKQQFIITDINLGGILDLIKQNARRNKSLIKSTFSVKEIDFTKELSNDIKNDLESVNMIFAADVIYDDDLTESFMKTLTKILDTPPTKSVLIALEKRYVFTLADLDSVAPCYETFLSLLKKFMKSEWTLEQIPIDFPQYFKYERAKELVLWKITSGKFK